MERALFSSWQNCGKWLRTFNGLLFVFYRAIISHILWVVPLPYVVHGCVYAKFTHTDLALDYDDYTS